MFTAMVRSFAACLCFVLLVSVPATAQENWHRIGIFLLPDDLPDTIMLVDDITEAAPVDFFRALRARPEATTLVLFSNGGSVYGGLSVALQVHERGMTTIVPKEAWCYSACAYVFFAGQTRKLEGDLGVHQISTEGDVSLSGAQTTIADILEALEAFDVNPGVLGLMFRTTAEDIHVFSATEIAQFGIESAVDIVEEAGLAPSEVATPVQLPVDIPDPVSSGDADVDPGATANVTVVAKNNASANTDRLERLLSVLEPTAFPEVLRQNGFPDAMAQAILEAMSEGDFFDMGIMPKDVQIIVLYGPSRSSYELIPYRLTFYAPKLDRMTQFAMVALSDSGQYVLSQAILGGSQAAQPNVNGKQNRR